MNVKSLVGKIWYLVGILLVLSFPAAVLAQEPGEISVYVNGSKVDFGESKPVIKNARTMAPARDIFGSLGAEIGWEPHSKTVTIGLDGREISLRIGYREAKYRTSEGSKTIISDAPPEIIDGAMYVPMSIIAVSLGGDVRWDDAERSAYVTFDSAPLLVASQPAPQEAEEALPPEIGDAQESAVENVAAGGENVEESAVENVAAGGENVQESVEESVDDGDENVQESVDESAESPSSIVGAAPIMLKSPYDAPVKLPAGLFPSVKGDIYEIPEIQMTIKTSGLSAELGDTREKIQLNLGKSDRRNESVYGFAWDEFNLGKGNYYLVGTNSEKAVAFYTNSKRATIAGITSGISAEKLNELLQTNVPLENKVTIRSGNYFMTIYRNSLDNYSVLAIMVKSIDYLRPVKVIRTDLFTAPTERQLAGLINNERIGRGLTPLSIDTKLSSAARSHSQAMSAGMYLSGEDENGKTPLDRLSALTGNVEMVLESIGRDNVDAFDMFGEWMNSRMDAANIIDELITTMGVGVSPCADGKHSMYFTADFIAK